MTNRIEYTISETDPQTQQERVDKARFEWAHKYDGYSRLAASPEQLREVLDPAWQEFEATGRIPNWCGVDLLRGWAFYMARAYRFAGGDSFDTPWKSVFDALSQHPEARPDDRPPSA